MLVETLEIVQSTLKNGQLLGAPRPFGGTILTFCCKGSDLIVCQIMHHFRAEQRGQFSDKAVFDGENADVVDELLQGHL